MGINWVCIYSSKLAHKVEIVKAVLADNNINSVIVNKQDSAYLFGEIELHVHPDDSMLAIQIIKKEKL
jgi:Putative prokaryotic signal transducing protein